MAVPASTRKVPRPVNTIVIDNGKDGPNRYAVRERSGTKYVPGGNPQPRNGKVIGHIVDGKYVPNKTVTAETGADMLGYGSSAFVHSVSEDILNELLQVYPAKDAFTIMAIASLKVIKPRITANRMRTHYDRTFISKFYPGLALSPNTICSFLQKLGQDGGKRRQFYQARAHSVIEDHEGVGDHVVYKNRFQKQIKEAHFDSVLLLLIQMMMPMTKQVMLNSPPPKISGT